MKIGTRAKAKIPPVEPGVYPAVCIGVVDLGEQELTFKGKTRYVNQVKIIFELPGELVEVDGEENPRQLSRNFTFSTSPKSALRQVISQWAGKAIKDDDFAEFDLFALLGRGGLLNVVHSEDGQYANISGVTAMPKGIPAPKTTTAYIKFDTEEWTEEAFDALPEYLQEALKNSTQYRNRHLPEETVSVEAAAAQAAADAEEEVPF